MFSLGDGIYCVYIYIYFLEYRWGTDTRNPVVFYSDLLGINKVPTRKNAASQANPQTAKASKQPGLLSVE